MCFSDRAVIGDGTVKKLNSALAWITVGVIAAVVLSWAFPRAYPLFPQDWEISRREAQAIALERLRDLGQLPAEPYVVTQQEEAPALEHRLQQSLLSGEVRDLGGSSLMQGLRTWQVTVFEPGATPFEWSYRARVTPSGDVTELMLRVPPEQEGGEIDEAAAREQADQFLESQGFDLGSFLEPEIRKRQLQARADLTLRYRDKEALLGDDHPYGVEVNFAGDRLAGYSGYFDDPELATIRSSFQTIQLLGQLKVFLPLLLLPLVAVPFVRRYHAGEIGVRRGVQISMVIVVAGVVTLLFCGGAASAGWSLGVLTRRQTTWVVGFQMLILFFFPMGLMSFLSWSVGESLCREKWGRKLAAFDALFKGDWQNATFARASLRGVVSGLVIVAAEWALIVLFRQYGIWAYASFSIGPWWESARWFSIPLLAFGLAYALYTGLFGRLFLVSFGTRHLGRWLGITVAVIAAAILFFSGTYVYPFHWNFLLWLLPPAAFVFLFLRFGIFTSILAYLTSFVVTGAVPFIGANDPSIQLHASLALLGVAVPLIASARHLLSDREFTYLYEDVPPHVRRIAERERQRVELETARGIQASILPELPPQLNGVKLSHKYLPATEVGGDFYDVLALEDGRLAVAVGDVAGHGVSSGLVMSMAKSALAVQVTFDPEVEKVFATLNRMVYQSARKRLLATLCYALIDPQRREMFYASAGHLFPYQITRQGEVRALESVSYPLGVRGEIDVRVRSARLSPGDALFLFSDGVVEARAEGSDELFGFERLESCLSQLAGKSVEAIRDGVLSELDRFTRNSLREDDLTVLVLEIP
jgi:hypothetical protein